MHCRYLSNPIPKPPCGAEPNSRNCRYLLVTKILVGTLIKWSEIMNSSHGHTMRTCPPIQLCKIWENNNDVIKCRLRIAPKFTLTIFLNDYNSFSGCVTSNIFERNSACTVPVDSLKDQAFLLLGIPHKALRPQAPRGPRQLPVQKHQEKQLKCEENVKENNSDLELSWSYSTLASQCHYV